MVAVSRGPRLTVPKIRTDWPTCGHHGPRYACNRAKDHTGRHCFSWRDLDGTVRGVWG